MYVCIYVYVCVYACIYVYVCMYVCMYIGLHLLYSVRNMKEKTSSETWTILRRSVSQSVKADMQAYIHIVRYTCIARTVSDVFSLSCFVLFAGRHYSWYCYIPFPSSHMLHQLQSISAQVSQSALLGRV